MMLVKMVAMPIYGCCCVVLGLYVPPTAKVRGAPWPTVEPQTPEHEVRGSIPTSAVLCP